MSAPRPGHSAHPAHPAAGGPLRRLRSLVTADPSDPDRWQVRSRALRVGLWVALAVALIVGALAVVILTSVSPAALLDGGHEAHLVLGAGDLLELGLVLGVLAVVAAGVIGALAARSAISPLAEALARQRRFVADASHELRTPATVLDLRVQRLQRVMDPQDPHRVLVDELRRDSRRLGDVIGDMLAAVEQDLTAADPAGCDDADVAQVAHEVCSDLEPLAQEREATLRPEILDGAAHVPLSAVTLARILTALVDNALKHAPPGTSVDVVVREGQDQVTILVRDRGLGIQGIAVEQVFDRFARSSPAAGGGGDTGRGFGIGLSLVQDAVTRAGGSVRVAATGSQGTTFEIVLPCTARH